MRKKLLSLLICEEKFITVDPNSQAEFFMQTYRIISYNFSFSIDLFKNERNFACAWRVIDER